MGSGRCSLSQNAFLPAFTTLAKGDAAKAIGLMALLAATSALAAPLLLQWLIPFILDHVPATSMDPASLSVNALSLAGSLFLAQLLPLGAGLAIRHRAPYFAAMAKKPAERLSALLNIGLLSLIVYAQFDAIVAVPPRAFLGMSLLLAAGAGAGFVVGNHAERRELAIAVAVRNVGVAIAVVGSQLPGTPAVAATTIFALFQTVVMAGASAAWGRFASPPRQPFTTPTTPVAAHPVES
ncbi:MAG: bile acid:sodium symporter [Gemmataceae bacterium]